MMFYLKFYGGQFWLHNFIKEDSNTNVKNKDEPSYRKIATQPYTVDESLLKKDSLLNLYFHYSANTAAIHNRSSQMVH